MATDYFSKINQTPEFLKEYEGKYIYDTGTGKRYKVANGQVSEFDAEAANQQWLKDNNLRWGQYNSGQFMQSVFANEYQIGESGLDWDRKLGDTSKLGYRYINQATPEYQQAANNNFGLGATRTPEEIANNAAVLAQVRGEQAGTLTAPNATNVVANPTVSMAMTGTSSTPPAGAVQVMNPAELSKLTESQIWRDPNSNKIYKLQQATLYSPTGQKQVVTVGSSQASNLLKAGWTLNPQDNSGVVNGNTLTPQKEIDTATGLPKANGSLADSTMAGIGVDIKNTEKTIADNLKLLQAPESDLSRQVEALLGTATTSAASLVGRETMQLEEERKRNIEAQNQAIADKNIELQKKVAEVKALEASYALANQQEEGRPQTLSRLQGAQAQNYKMFLAQKNALAAEAGYIQAELLGMQGKLQTAQAAADRAVELEYADRQSKYNAQIAQLNILLPQLEKEEKRYATALQMTLEQQANALAEEKANKQNLVNYNLELMATYPQAGITTNDSPEVATQKVASVTAQIMASKVSSGGGSSSGGKIAVAPTSEGNIANLSPEVQSWVNLINNGKATISNVPAALKTEVAQGLQQNVQPVTQTKEQSDALEKVALIDSLLTSSGLNSAVGPTSLSRGKIFGIPFGADYYTGANASFIGGVEQLISQDTLQTLLDLKKGGGTLGALSDQERIMLKSAASKIGSWAITDENGKVTGYNIDQKSFIAELNRIKALAQKAISNVSSPDIQTMPDGTKWKQNADGTYTQI